MKKAAALILFLVPVLLLAQDDEQKRIVLIKEKLIASNQYMIVARGYPKPGLTEKLQIQGTAREAALLNAQVLARQKFKESLDTIQHGTAKNYTNGDGYVDVTYIITYPGIKRYLRAK
jgi:hypothetical protein